MVIAKIVQFSHIQIKLFVNVFNALQTAGRLSNLMEIATIAHFTQNLTVEV